MFIWKVAFAFRLRTDGMEMLGACIPNVLGGRSGENCAFASFLGILSAATVTVSGKGHLPWAKK
jgi:hypothetical protein